MTIFPIVLDEIELILRLVICIKQDWTTKITSLFDLKSLLKVTPRFLQYWPNFTDIELRCKEAVCQ